MTEEQLVDRVFAREGDKYGDPTTKPPIDQPTARGGIILPTLQAYYDAAEPGRRANVLDLQTMSHAQARVIVRWFLRRLSGLHHFDLVAFEPLRLHLVDFAYNSGAERAIRWLQRVLNVEATGTIDAATVDALNASQRLIHQALIAARLQMIDAATDAGSVSKTFEEGLENRALEFSLLKV